MPSCICLRLFPHRLSRPSPGVPSLDIYPVPDIASAAPTLTSDQFPGLPWPWLLSTRYWTLKSRRRFFFVAVLLLLAAEAVPGFRFKKLEEWRMSVCDHNSQVSTWSARWVYLNELDPKNGNHKSKIIPLAAKNVWFNIFRSKMLRGIFSSILSSMIWKIS